MIITAISTTMISGASLLIVSFSAFHLKQMSAMTSTVMAALVRQYTRPSGSREAQRESWYSLAQGIRDHQPLTPDFVRSFQAPRI